MRRTSSTDLDASAMFPLIREPLIAKELHTVSDNSSWKTTCPKTGYRRIKSVLDSGATDSCAPDDMCPEIPNQSSEGSRRGQVYTSAGGAKISNDGEKQMTMMTATGDVVDTTWQTVDIARPLSSVRQICQQGNRVIFGAGGGVIYHVATQRETPFRMEGGVYVLDLWVPDFQRQGHPNP